MRLRKIPVVKLVIAFSCLSMSVSYVNCGMVKAPAAKSGMASNGFFDHAGITGACASCHDSGKPFDGFKGINSILTNQMLHTISGLPDCSTCHLAGATANRFSSWTTGETISNSSITTLGSLGVFHSNFSPTSCSNCHSGLAPSAATTDVNGATVPAHTAIFMGSTDCLGCHSSGTGLDWTKATATGHTAGQTNCAQCHSTTGSDPTKYLAVYNTVTNQMLHTHAGLPDCSSCHITTANSNGFTSWAVETDANPPSTARTTLGFYHSNVSSNSTCVDCHAGEVPSGTVNLVNGTDGFNHASTYGTECATCHTTVVANVGLSWAKGYFNHNGNNSASFGSSCLPCHTHHNTSQNCANCHTPSYLKWPMPSSTGSYGGGFGQP